MAILQPKLAKANDSPDTEETTRERPAREAHKHPDDAQNLHVLRAKTVTETRTLENTPGVRRPIHETRNTKSADP